MLFIFSISIPNNITFAENNLTTAEISFKTQSENSLEIIHVPNLDFGTYTYGQNSTISDKSQEPYIHIKDSTGSYTGWNLTVKTHGFTVNGKTNTNFKLIFKQPKIVPSKDNDATLAPTFKNTEIIANDSPTEILKASSNEGIGHWNALFYDPNSSENSNIQLKIPSSAYEGKYSANLIWELNSGPDK